MGVATPPYREEMGVSRHWGSSFGEFVAETLQLNQDVRVIPGNPGTAQRQFELLISGLVVTTNAAKDLSEGFHMFRG